MAPIVNGNAALATYDFWAVGLNCCSGVSSDFRCGEFNNQHARSGLRLMRDDQRPFYRQALGVTLPLVLVTISPRIWCGLLSRILGVNRSGPKVFKEPP